MIFFAYINSRNVNMENFYRSRGSSVRLVRDYKPDGSGTFDREGASYKRFSVSATTTVRFSKGNLQYNAAQDEWRFATKQYLCIGDGNANIVQDYNGWIDLFCWGTSGWNSGAVAYQPWSTSRVNTDYYPGGYDTVNLTGDYANADWGVFNPINNGGNNAGMWRTLTKDEWGYLLGNSTTRSGKYGLATIYGASKSYTGLVILPDDWTLPGGVTFTDGYGNGFTTNSYTATQWQAMESVGAIFLPAAGLHSTDVYNVGTNGYYWSSSYYSDIRAYNMYFHGTRIISTSNDTRNYGYSVRLVRD
jgi:uncharacterized protein (TIGR02145 family)